MKKTMGRSFIIAVFYLIILLLPSILIYTEGGNELKRSYVASDNDDGFLNTDYSKTTIITESFDGTHTGPVFTTFHENEVDESLFISWSTNSSKVSDGSHREIAAIFHNESSFTEPTVLSDDGEFSHGAGCGNSVEYMNKIYTCWERDYDYSSGYIRDIYIRSVDDNGLGRIYKAVENSNATYPYLTTYNGTLFLFWHDRYGNWMLNNRVYYKTFDGKDWSESYLFLDEGQDWICDSIEYDNRLYILYSLGYYQIYLKSYDGVSWSQPEYIGPLRIGCGGNIFNFMRCPEIVCFQDKLYVFWDSNNLTLATDMSFSVLCMKMYNGEEWSQIEIIKDGYQENVSYGQILPIVFNERLFIIVFATCDVYDENGKIVELHHDHQILDFTDMTWKSSITVLKNLWVSDCVCFSNRIFLIGGFGDRDITDIFLTEIDPTFFINSLSVSTETKSLSFSPDETREISCTLVNDGPDPISIEIDYSFNGSMWDINLGESFFTIDSNEAITKSFNITAPKYPVRSDLFELEINVLHNKGDIVLGNTLEYDLHLNVNYNVTLLNDDHTLSFSRFENQPVSFQLHLKNRGNIEDTAFISLDEQPNDWSIEWWNNSKKLAPNEETNITVSILPLMDRFEYSNLTLAFIVGSNLSFRSDMPQFNYEKFEFTIKNIYNSIPHVEFNLASVIPVNSEYLVTLEILDVDNDISFSKVKTNGSFISHDINKNDILIKPAEGNEGIFFINVTVTDSNESIGFNNQTFTVIDLSAPDPPTNLKIMEIDETSVTVSWDKSDSSIDVIGYELYVNNLSIVIDNGSTLYKIDGLQANAEYIINIKAFDEVPNYSINSTDLVFQTLSELDIDKDGVFNQDDAFPTDPSVSIDTDGDGLPDSWNPGKDQSDSTTGLHLDDFPADPSASIDSDGDGMPDRWNNGMDQNDSTSDPPLQLDPYPNDPDNIPPDNDGNETPANGKSKTWIWASGIAAVVIVVAVAVVLLFHKKKEPPEDQDDHGGVEAKPNEERNK